METQLSAPATPEPKAPLDIAKFTGNYYLVLATLTWLATPICCVFGHEYLDGSFILWYWIGTYLKRYSRGARRWTIFLSVCVSASMLLALTNTGAEFNFGWRVYGSTEPMAYLISAAIWSVFAIPAIMLLTRNGRDTFSIRREYFRDKTKA